jgi:hypothetical protein
MGGDLIGFRDNGKATEMRAKCKSDKRNSKTSKKKKKSEEDEEEDDGSDVEGSVGGDEEEEVNPSEEEDESLVVDSEDSRKSEEEDDDGSEGEGSGGINTKDGPEEAKSTKEEDERLVADRKDSKGGEEDEDDNDGSEVKRSGGGNEKDHYEEANLSDDEDNNAKVDDFESYFGMWENSVTKPGGVVELTSSTESKTFGMLNKENEMLAWNLEEIDSCTITYGSKNVRNRVHRYNAELKIPEYRAVDAILKPEDLLQIDVGLYCVAYDGTDHPSPHSTVVLYKLLSTWYVSFICL